MPSGYHKFNRSLLKYLRQVLIFEMLYVKAAIMYDDGLKLKIKIHQLKGISINCLCPLALLPVQDQGLFLKACSLPGKKHNAEPGQGAKPLFY